MQQRVFPCLCSPGLYYLKEWQISQQIKFSCLRRMLKQQRKKNLKENNRLTVNGIFISTVELMLNILGKTREVIFILHYKLD